MIDIDRLNDEAYALKVIIHMINIYIPNDTDKITAIKTLTSLHGCIPGRIIWPIFVNFNIDETDKRIIQEIISIYS
jgi:hypothetical protein